MPEKIVKEITAYTFYELFAGIGLVREAVKANREELIAHLVKAAEEEQYRFVTELAAGKMEVEK